MTLVVGTRLITAPLNEDYVRLAKIVEMREDQKLIENEDYPSFHNFVEQKKGRFIEHFNNRISLF